MITAQDFNDILALLGDDGQDDLKWSQSLQPPADAEEFAREVIFVIANSGMKNTVARGIYNRCIKALEAGHQVAQVFGHRGKAAAMESIWARRYTLHLEWWKSEDRLAYLEGLPWIGKITKYHVAKNFGQDVAKPDVHLQRLADREGCTAQQLCERLASELQLRIATVDTILWRACANGILNSRTGAINKGARPCE